jgi:polysaccharide biosynthesis transport protein
LAASLCTVHAAKSPAAEAFRGVRTSLYFSTQGQGHKVIQVTSPSMGDGKSTLAANLAVSIAHSGKRVLIIDADFRRPRQHRLFHVSTQRGLASLIAEEAEPEDIILSTAVANLSILPCGPRPNNPAELLTSPRFPELLGLFRERYDFVIVDTPPLLAVSDPMVVAPRVDAVMLTMRLTNNGRPNAERAKEMLATIGANILGVVVNGFGAKGAGGYGGEGYGYQYAYAGGYYQDGEDSGVNVNGSKAGDDPDDAEDANSAVDLGALPRRLARPKTHGSPRGSWLSRMWGA